MDIHAPERPIRSIKEFGIHIAIVTIGILIALSLEGIREWVHDTRLVHETIANFREELEVDWVHDTDELKRVREADELLKSLVA